jgi:hypothetical protein
VVSTLAPINCETGFKPLLSNFNLYRYISPAAAAAEVCSRGAVGLYNLNAVDPGA